MGERHYHSEKPPAPESKVSAAMEDDFQIRKKKKVFWNIEELEEFFKTAELPVAPVPIPGTTMNIVNVEKFISSHLETIKRHNGNKTYLPDYERLLKFKKLIQDGEIS